MTTGPHGFVVHARHWMVTCPERWTGVQVTELLSALFDGLLAGLMGTGRPMIGHIKCLARAEGVGHLMLSVTRYGEPLRPRGSMSGELSCFELTLNVIVQGASPEQLQRIVSEALPEFPGVAFLPAMKQFVPVQPVSSRNRAASPVTHPEK